MAHNRSHLRLDGIMTEFETMMRSEELRADADAMADQVIADIARRWPDTLDRMLVYSALTAKASTARDTMVDQFITREVGMATVRPDGGHATGSVQPYQWVPLSRLSGLSETTLRRREQVIVNDAFRAVGEEV
jgi:hypothetical protein